MTQAQHPPLFDGPISTPLSPFHSDGRIAPELLNEHLSWEAEHGITGVFVLGTWGGFPLLNLDERIALSQQFVEAATAAGLKSVVHIGSPCLSDADRLIKTAESAGATAIAATVPFYHSAAGYYDLNHYRAHFASLLESSSLPLFLYNNPRTTGVLLKPQDFVTLVADGLHGVKDGSKDAGWIISTQNQLASANLSAEIIPGNTSALGYAHLYDLHAVTSGAAVSFPKLISDVFGQLRGGNLQQAAQLHRALTQTRSIIASYGNPAMATYSLLTEMGVPALGAPRSPWRGLKRSAARELLAELKSHPLTAEHVAK